MNRYALINYWPINNNSMNDYVGTSNMIYGANNTYCPDRFNNTNSALNFENGFNTVPSGFYFNGDFTVSVWIYYNQNPALARVLEFSNSKTDIVSIQASYSTSGFPGITINVGSGTPTNTYLLSPSLETGRWYHVVYGLCGTTAKIYVDGQLKVSGTQSRPANVNRTTNFIGGNNYGYANLNARLDELRIYGRCMSQNEIMNLINFSNA